MNADDMMKYGHQTLMASLDVVDTRMLEIEGACGTWSVKDILAHLTSFEWVLVDALRQIKGESVTPHLDDLIEQGDKFNDLQVARRAEQSYDQQLTEYLSAHVKATALLAEIPIETRRTKGIIPWYGESYDLDDYIVYSIYAHKREHCGQIDVFKDSDVLRQTVKMTSIAPYWMVS